MRISDWSSDVCSSDLHAGISFGSVIIQILLLDMVFSVDSILTAVGMTDHLPVMVIAVVVAVGVMLLAADPLARSEEHTSELQSLMRISYAVFCLKKKKYTKNYTL